MDATTVTITLDAISPLIALMVGAVVGLGVVGAIVRSILS